MKDGQIIDGKVWFGFDAEELLWLFDRIPREDIFKGQVARGMRELQLHNQDSPEPLHLVNFSQAEPRVLREFAQEQLRKEDVVKKAVAYQKENPNGF